MANGMEMNEVLFLPDRFTDYRMWSDIPDRIRSEANASHFDQHDAMPWTANVHGFVEAARDLAPHGSFDLVAAAHDADRLAFVLAETELARSVVLFQPSIPSSAIPDGVRPDYSGLDLRQILEEAADAYGPLAEAILHDPDPGRRREALVKFVRNYAGVRLEPPELELATNMISDHAEEIVEAVRTFVAVDAEGGLPEHPWADRPWGEQFASVAVPMTLIVPRRARPVADAVVAGRDVEVVTSDGMGGLATQEDRAQGADAIVRMLSRVRGG